MGAMLRITRTDHTGTQLRELSVKCSDSAQVRRMLDYNGVTGYHVHDAREMPLRALPGPFDLIYGFYSIGFHWSLEYYLDDLEPLMHEHSVLVCTLNKNFRPFAALEKFHTRVLSCREVKKNAPPLQLLVLSRAPLPL